MSVVVGVLMLLSVCQGVEFCDGREDGAQCYGSLDGDVVLQLMDDVSQIYRFEWRKNQTEKILHWINGKLVSNKLKDRSIFTLYNGTFRINNLRKNDSGMYTLEIHNTSGSRIKQVTLALNIEAPVSSVLMKSKCLSHGEKSVSCTSLGGDDPQYSWTLNGRRLSPAELLSGDNTNASITLKQHISGQLVCTVQNHISRVPKEETISTCGFIFINCTSLNGTHISQWAPKDNKALCVDPTGDLTSGTATHQITVYLGGALSALLVLVVVGVAVVCAQKKKRSPKDTAEDDGQDLTYADLSFSQQHGGRIQQRAEMEVEYDQVRVSRQRPQAVDDHAIYAVVCKAR